MSPYELIEKLKERNIDFPIMYGNQNIVSIKKSTKRKPAIIEIAVTDEIADKFLSFPMDAMALFLALPVDEVKKIYQENKQ